MSDENGQGDDAADDWADAMNEQAESEAQAVAPEILEESVDENTIKNEKLDVILDIPVSMSLEVGRTQIPIRNLLQLTQGSVVELDRLAGEPLDVMVNGTLIAHGEVVVINEKYGIRLTDVMSPHERIQKLK
ncbi:MAG: flagellar motor switch protein FliN [Kangiellaceae bacterium]|jgi:flagellar motor switch protein FliN